MTTPSASTNATSSGKRMPIVCTQRHGVQHQRTLEVVPLQQPRVDRALASDATSVDTSTRASLISQPTAEAWHAESEVIRLCGAWSIRVAGATRRYSAGERRGRRQHARRTLRRFECPAASSAIG